MAHWNPVDQMQDLVNKMGGENAIKRFLSGELVLVERDVPALLTPVAEFSALARERFVAKDHFKVDTSRRAAVKIGYLGDNFTKHFLGKTEQDVPATTLVISTLTKNSLDAPILTNLGERAQTFLAQLWQMLVLQPKGESGVLRTDGTWNIFYIQDVVGNIWAVYALWDADYGGWSVIACSVGSPYGWRGGRPVVSRK